MISSNGQEDCGDWDHEILLHWELKLTSIYWNSTFQKADAAKGTGLFLTF